MATVFSWKLYIDGFEVEHFGRMSISQSVSGYGTSGVVTATMTFVTPHRLYGEGIAFETYDIQQNAEVRLVCDDIFLEPPLFYVTSRKKRGCITEWICCDVVSKTDRLIEFNDNDFDENDQITISALLSKIHAQSGIGINANGLFELTQKTFDKEKCDGLTIRSVFETLSEALCGYWFGLKDKIVFANFGQTVFAAFPEKYTPIDMNGSVAYARVLCTDNEAVYTSDATASGKTMIVTTDFASQELTDSIHRSMVGENGSYTYRSWSCDKGKTDEWLYPGAYQFGDELLVCNNISMTVSAAGLFYTVSSNSIDEDEVGYTSEVNRQLKKKLEFDKINGNVAITGKGLYFFENGYKNKTPEEQKKGKYSFKVENGVTEYTGTLKSKKLPEIQVNSDQSGFKMQYEDTSFEYEVTIDGDNVTLKEKKEAE